MTTDSKALAVRGGDDSRALEPTSFESALKCAEMIHKAGIGGTKSPEDALVRIMAGRAQGLSAIESLRLVHVINGRPGYDATFIRAKCLRLPDCEYFEPVPGEVTATKATFRAKRRGRPEQVASFGVEDAQRAKLDGKDNYKAWPADMFAARATTRLARLVFPEATAGMYTGDELSTAIDTVGESVDEHQRTAEEVDELTGEVVQAAVAEPADHDKALAELKAQIDEVKASGDKARRQAIVEIIQRSDMPPGHIDQAKLYYKAAFANGAKAQPSATT